MITEASILAPLTGDFGAASVAELALIGGAAGAVGVWVLYFSRAFLVESFGHALLPGLVLAAAWGQSLIFGAIAGAVAAYVVLSTIEDVPRTSRSSATSISVTVMVALGALLATRGTGAGSFEALLFGDPLAADWFDVFQAAVFAGGVAVLLFVFHHRLAAAAFDGDGARAMRIDLRTTTALLTALIIVAISVVASTTGSLLALALMLGPALAAERVGDARGFRLPGVMLLAVGLGSIAGPGGIYLSYYADWPASASVTLIACAITALAYLTPRARAFSGPGGPSARGSSRRRSQPVRG